MLKEIKLGNFKAFGDTQKIPIRPLTLIFGPNSSGKSSIIHSLALAHHAIKNGELDVQRTEIGGDSIDLGGFKQYVHKRNQENAVELAFKISKDSFTKRLIDFFPNCNTITVSSTITLTQPSKSLEVLMKTLFDDVFHKQQGQASVGVAEDEVRKLIYKLFGDKTPKETVNYLISNAKEAGNQTDEEALKKLLADDSFMTYMEESMIDGKAHVGSFEIFADDKAVLSFSYRPEQYFQLDRFSNDGHAIIDNIILSMTTSATIETEDIESALEGINEIVPSIKLPIKNPGGLFPDIAQPEKSPLLMPVSRGNRKDDIKQAFIDCLPNIVNEVVSSLVQIINTQINSLYYLGPLRSYPPRHIAFSQYHDPNWQAGGGHAWDIVRTNNAVRAKVNQWLGNSEKLSTSYELRIRNLLTIDDIEKKYFELYDRIFRDKKEQFDEQQFDEASYVINEVYEETIDEIPQRLKAFESIISDTKDLILFDKKTKTLVSHRDVGIGISQVLPVLVSAYASNNKMIAIEQPEIHLHPALQAELGDVFIESALGDNKNNFILETHSEHLILRMLRRIRETADGELPSGAMPLRPDQLAILYVKPGKNGSEVIHIPVTDEGEFAQQWPDGFFPDRAQELF